MVFSPNLGFLNRGLGPTVRETVLVTRTFSDLQDMFRNKVGMGQASVRRGIFGCAHRERRIHTLCAAAGSLLLLCVCACSILRNKQRAGLGCGLTDWLPDIWAGPGGGWTNIGRPCVFQHYLQTSNLRIWSELTEILHSFLGNSKYILF